MKLHLHQFLSRTGIFKTKNELIETVKRGEVTIDNEVIVNPMYRFNPAKRSVKYKGIKLEVIDKIVYYLVNKPEGYLSTRLTPLDIKNKKKSVFDLLKVDENIKRTLFCVGRLDEDTSGLLIITNDGKLGYKIAHPKTNIKKTYYAVLAKPLLPEQANKIEEGVLINLEENGKYFKYKTLPCKIKIISEKANRELLISITEGKKREVRRIFETIGNKVIKLERIAISGLKLKDLNLKQSEYKEVNKAYIQERLSV